jgi:hypothetical protein
MNKIYDKDECDRDALSSEQWIEDNKDVKINWLKHPHIDVYHEFNQDRTRYFSVNSKHFKIEYSCGVYETLFELTLQETIAELTKAATQLNSLLTR